MFIRKIFSGVSLIIFASASFAQVTPSVQEADLAKQLLGKYEKASAVLLKSETTIEFKLDAKAGPYLVEDKSMQYMSLRTNNLVSQFEYYDNQSEILQASASNNKGKRIALSPVCGNYESGSIFYSDAKVCKYKLDFSFSGEIQHLNFQKKFTDLKYYTSIYFNDVYPAHARKITIVIPDWAQVELKELNFEGYAIKKTEKAHTAMRAKIYEYEVQHLDSFKDEKYARGHSYTYPHILVLSKSYTSNGVTNPVVSSVNDLYNWYASLVSAVKNDCRPFEATVKQLTAGKSTDEDKIKAIYYWVQDNVRYIAFEDGIAGFKPESAHTVFSNKYGDCKGMANLTKQMLKLAGYDARLTWIGTNKIAYDYSIPSLAVDNHMICTVLLKDKKYFLDATEKFVPLNENAERIQGRQVMIEDGTTYMLDRVPVASKERNRITSQYALQIENNSLSGSGTTEYNGEMKTGLLYMLNEATLSDRATLLDKITSQGDKNNIISQLEHSNLQAREKPLILNYKLSLNNHVSSFDNELYIDIDHDHAYSDFIIKPQRVSDIMVNGKIMNTTKVTLKIPAGYTVTQLPPSFEKKHEAFSMLIRYTQNNGEISYEKQITIDQGIIRRQDFEAWNEAVKSLKQAYSNKLTLNKM